MIQKKDFLLNQMIKEYIRCQEPIGSESLKVSLGVKISSATIRNYFKILGEEGVIMQTHISSGRIPTPMALRNFWRSTLNPVQLCPVIIDSDKIAKNCEKFEVTCVIKPIITQKLIEVIEVEQKAIVLVFEHDRIAIPFIPNMAHFCQELVGLHVDDIRKIAKDVCAKHLAEALCSLKSAPKIHFFGLQFLDELLAHQPEVVLAILQGDIFSQTKNNIFFPNNGNYIVIAHNAIFKDNESEMLCIGKLQKDYEMFYQHIA